MTNITIKELLKLDLNKIQLIDIREEYEWNIFHLKESKLIPKDELINRLWELNKDEEIYLICRTWQRTWFMTQVLNNLGYKAVNVLWWITEYIYNKLNMKIKKFYMKGCAPCEFVTGLLKEFEWLNVEEIEMSDWKLQAKLIKEYWLTNVPTLIFYVWDEEIWRLDWYISKEQITKILEVN